MKPEEYLRHVDNFKKALPRAFAKIVANTALQASKEAFQKKAWDNRSWPAAKTKKKGGSLLIKSGALMNSVRITQETNDKVVISAGNSKVAYAQVHNEGGKAGRGKGFTMPRRQFGGESRQIENTVKTRTENYINNNL